MQVTFFERGTVEDNVVAMDDSRLFIEAVMKSACLGCAKVVRFSRTFNDVRRAAEFGAIFSDILRVKEIVLGSWTRSAGN